MSYTVNIAGVDKTSLLLNRSLNIQKGADNRSSCSLSLKTTSAYIDVIGLDLQVLDGSTVVFGGVIKTASITKLEPGTGTGIKLKLDITSDGYSGIPARRTTTSVYENTTAGAVVTDMLDNVLNSTGADDNIGTGTISTGATLTNYAAICKSVKQVLDDMASASGYKWYINDSRELMFVAEDTVTDAAHDLVEGGVFTDYDIESVDISMDDYCNKQFIKGGTDENGNILIYVAEDTTEITARQTAEGAAYSSGVYGNVIEDSSITNETDAAVVAANALKKNGFAPSTIQFTSFTNDWAAGTKLKVNLPTFGISTDTYYLIENMTITEPDGANLMTTITAVKRKSDDFSTQRNESYIDYFAKMASGGADGGVVENGAGYATGVNLYVQPNAPTGAKTKDAWIDTDDYTRYDETALTANTTLTTADNEVITCSGTFTVTLHEGTAAGIIKKIYNVGTGIVTIAGTINGLTNMTLYPGESVELITDGTDWRC